MTTERIAQLPADDWAEAQRQLQEPLLSRNLNVVEPLGAIGDRYKLSPGEVANAWTLRNPAVTAAIVGVRTAKEVRGIVGTASFELSEADAAEIESAVT